MLLALLPASQAFVLAVLGARLLVKLGLTRSWPFRAFGLGAATLVELPAVAVNAVLKLSRLFGSSRSATGPWTDMSEPFRVVRAAFAERQGFGFSLRRAEVYKIAAVIDAISRPEVRAKMREAALEHASSNGAGVAAEAIEELARSAKGLDATLDLDIHRRAVM